MQQFEEGKRIFRFDTFGDEAFWGDTLKLRQAIAGDRNGGGGPGLSPASALWHSTVDDALAPGIGRRLDGWANRDLDV